MISWFLWHNFRFFWWWMNINWNGNLSKKKQEFENKSPHLELNLLKKGKNLKQAEANNLIFRINR